jgi:hypothetical protein
MVLAFLWSAVGAAALLVGALVGALVAYAGAPSRRFIAVGGGGRKDAGGAQADGAPLAIVFDSL